MGIYIRGMEMPKTCNDCWALDDDGDYPRCIITEEQRGYTFKIREQRMSKCPLEPHGEWIKHEIKDTCRWIECSECHKEYPNIEMNFCPNCGKRMRGGNTE